MNAAEKQLAALRAARNAARADLLARYAKVKPLTSPKALGQRLRGDVEQHARGAMVQAMEIASDNRGVLAGTLTALLLWAARKQLFQSAAQMVPKAEPLIARVAGKFGWLIRSKKGGPQDE